MANPYTAPSISGYNASPPEDDGSQTSTNEITWAGIKTKITDPIKTLAESDITNTTAAFEILNVTAGTATASKALVVDANKDIDLGTGDLTATIINATTLQAGGVAITATPAEINSALDGITATFTELNYNDITTLGTAEASKTVTCDASKDIVGLNSVTSTTFVGALTGNASTATSATSSTTQGLTWLETQTASTSTSIDMTTGIDSTYDQYVIRLTDYRPVNDGVAVYMRVSSDGGSSFLTTANYAYGVTALSASTGTETISSNGGDTAIVLAGTTGIGNVATEGMDVTITMMNPSSTAKYVSFSWQGVFWDNSGVMYFFRGGGSYHATTAINAIRFVHATGNITSGTCSSYGAKK